MTMSDAIARLAGTDFLERELDQDDDRMAGAITALAYGEDPAVDRQGLAIRLQRLLEDPNPYLAATAIDGLRGLGDRTAHDRVLELLDRGPGVVRVQALIYVRVLFGGSALPLLLAALHDPDARVQFCAVDQLDELEQFTDRDTFQRMLDDPDEDVREHARYILEHHFA